MITRALFLPLGGALGVVLALVFAPAAHAQMAPMDVTSTGAELEVTVSSSVGSASCLTPCRLLLSAGEWLVESEAHGVRRNREAILVPPDGAELRLNAASGAAHAWGWILTALGAASVVLGAVFVGFILEGAANDPYNQMMAGMIGGVTGAIGIAGLSAGLALVLSNQPGIEVRPLGARE
ncbi:MAG: hypothetical protein AB7S26_23465 [Sandaracinaceae bacterium]